tara:strand:+ start:1743 stop:1955 length:213 start_codon:yes stop_codon:yes gene_type:complete
MNKEKKIYLWKNVAVYKTFQEASNKRKEYLNEDTLARLDVKISKQAKGFVVKVRTKPEVQESESNKKKKK